MSELNPKQLDALVSLLDDPDLEVKNHVRDKIISLGAEIIPFLEQKWETSFNPEVQKEIEELVHDLQFSLVKTRLAEWRDSEDRDLLTGLWILNTYQYPDLDFAKLNAEMHQIYFEVWTALKTTFNPMSRSGLSTTSSSIPCVSLPTRKIFIPRATACSRQYWIPDEEIRSVCVQSIFW
jgi:hypothetical protein